MIHPACGQCAPVNLTHGRTAAAVCTILGEPVR